MRSEYNEDLLDKASQKVALQWSKDTLGYDPEKDEYVASYVAGTMLDPSWDALEMFSIELMALGMRKMYGYDTPIEQD
jgi:hypothetical protein